jgi:hypothetical protein
MVVRVVNNSNDARTHIMYIIDQMGVSPKRKPTGDLEFELPVNAFDKFSTMIQPVAATVGKPAVAGGNSHVVVQVQFPQY